MEYLHSQVYHFGNLCQACEATAEELYRAVDRVSELHREVTPPGEFEVPEVLEVHVVPSDEVRMVSDSIPCFLMVPELPTATKILFP